MKILPDLSVRGVNLKVQDFLMTSVFAQMINLAVMGNESV